MSRVVLPCSDYSRLLPTPEGVGMFGLVDELVEAGCFNCGPPKSTFNTSFKLQLEFQPHLIQLLHPLTPAVPLNKPPSAVLGLLCPLVLVCPNPSRLPARQWRRRRAAWSPPTYGTAAAPSCTPLRAAWWPASAAPASRRHYRCCALLPHSAPAPAPAWPRHGLGASASGGSAQRGFRAAWWPGP
jgi:hypothetical protein